MWFNSFTKPCSQGLGFFRWHNTCWRSANFDFVLEESAIHLSMPEMAPLPFSILIWAWNQWRRISFCHISQRRCKYGVVITPQCYCRPVLPVDYEKGHDPLRVLPFGSITLHLHHLRTVRHSPSYIYNQGTWLTVLFMANPAIILDTHNSHAFKQLALSFPLP
jgi:hypothetical protein